MAGHGVGILQLEGVVVRVLPQLLEPLAPGGDVGIVEQHLLVKAMALLGGERGRNGRKRIEQHAALQFVVVVIGEAERGIGKMETVLLVDVADAHHLGRIAVGDKVERQPLALGQLARRPFRPVVIVLDGHDQIATGELFLAVEDTGADAVVVDVGPLVGPRNDDGVRRAILAIGRNQGFDEFVARQETHLARRRTDDAGQSLESVREQAAQPCGAGQYAGGLVLTDYLRQVGFVNTQAVAADDGRTECRALGLAYGRKLGRIADQQQPAALALINVTDKVVEQEPAAEQVAAGVEGYHGGFVDDEHGLAQAVEAQGEAGTFALEGLLPVDDLVDGVGGRSGQPREHLGRPAGRSQEHHFAAQAPQHADQGRDERCLPRAGIAAQDESGVGPRLRQEAGQARRGQGLTARKVVTEFLRKAVNQFVGNHTESIYGNPPQLLGAAGRDGRHRPERIRVRQNYAFFQNGGEEREGIKRKKRNFVPR